MNLSAIFIKRPVTTTLLIVGILVFGGLAYQILKRNPRARYIGFDLPENMFLQSYYLSCAFPDLAIKTFDGDTGEITASALARYDAILLPNFVLPRLESGCADLTD